MRVMLIVLCIDETEPTQGLWIDIYENDKTESLSMRRFVCDECDKQQFVKLAKNCVCQLVSLVTAIYNTKHI